MDQHIMDIHVHQMLIVNPIATLLQIVFQTILQVVVMDIVLMGTIYLLEIIKQMVILNGIMQGVLVVRLKIVKRNVQTMKIAKDIVHFGVHLLVIVLVLVMYITSQIPMNVKILKMEKFRGMEELIIRDFWVIGAVFPI